MQLIYKTLLQTEIVNLNQVLLKVQQLSICFIQPHKHMNTACFLLLGHDSRP